MTESFWQTILATNLLGPFRCSHAAAPALKKTQGAIVNITDIHAERPLKNYVVYSVAKAGLVGLTRSLARELAPEVRVCGVAPGPVAIEREQEERRAAETLLGRVGSPDDIADAVVYLASAGFVTGTTLVVDGGRSLQSGGAQKP